MNNFIILNQKRKLLFSIFCKTTHLITAFVLSFLFNGQVNGQNNALNFDGNDDRVRTTSFPAVSGNFTAEAWVRPATTTGNTTIISTRNTGGSDFNFDFKLQNGNLIHGDIGTGSGWLTIVADASFTYTAGVWYHIAYTVTNTGYSIYANGALVGSGSYAFNTPLFTDGTSNMDIGHYNNLEFFNGSIDEVRIWNTVRTPTEIAANMSRTLTGSESGLVAYYNFNQGVANANNAGITTLNDLASTGGTNNANVVNFMLNGTTSNWVGGAPVPTINALSFDGTDDEVIIPDNAALQLTNTMTLEGWMYLNSFSNEPPMVTKGDDNGYIIWVGGDGRPACRIGGGTTTIQSPSPITLNTWHHIAVTYDGSIRRMYINGTQVATVSNPAVANTGTNPVRLGRWQAPASRLLNGQLDEVRIWNLARTCEQINSVKDRELIGNESGLVAYYNFNQGTPGGTNTGITTLVDLANGVGGANNGTLTNFGTLTGSTSNWIGSTNGVSGTTPVSQPEINVQGNSISIVDGDITPSTTDHTDFGTINVGNNLARTFTIQNSGAGVLNITSITSNNAKFVISGAPTTVAASSSATFTITYTPTISATDNATITINNNDCDENVYDFAVRGVGLLTSPGGVSTNLRLWLKADAGVVQTTGVSQWNDQSTNGLNAVSGSNPTFVAGGLNFNPTIQFNGTTHRLATASTSLFSSNTSPVSFFTVFNTTNNSGQKFLINQRFNNNCVTNIQLGYSTGSGGIGNYGLHTGCGNAAVTPDATIPNNTYQMMSTLILNSGTSPNNINIFRNGTSLTMSNNGAGFTSAGGYETSTQNVPIEIGVRNDAYLGGSYDGFHAGNIGEIIIYTSTPTTTQRRQVESYLALKYGLTIDQTTATDYLASDGTTEMWNKDLTGASTYRNNIAGIGRDDLSALNQKQSRSINANTPLTIGLGTIATTNALNTNTFANDRRFLTWADNNTALASVSTTDIPNTGFPRRMARIWQAQEPNGDVGNTQVVLDITGTGLTGASASNFVLLLDNDAIFNNGITNSIVASSLVGNIVTFNNVNFTNGQYFSFANFTNSAISTARGNMMSLDGGDDEINCGTGINLANSSFTLECWARRATTGSDNHFFSLGTPTNNNGLHCRIQSDGTIRFAFWNDDYDAPSGTYSTDGLWHHYSFTYDATTNLRTVYVDGRFIGSNTATTDFQGTGVFNIGATVTGATPRRLWNGNLDEVRVWNTVRTQNQIRESMHLTLSGAETGLIGYWQFNETSGNAIDAINGNNGTLQNGATRIPSTVSVGAGKSKTVNVGATGTSGVEVDINTTGFEIDFTNGGTAPNGDLVIYQITAENPYNNLLAATTSCYWVVRNFGTNTTGLSIGNTRFRIPNHNTISTTDETTPSNLRIYKRPDNSGDATWGGSFATTGISASNSTKTIGFTGGFTSFSEFIISTGGTSSLPLMLLNFEGKRKDENNVLLNWKTTNEVNTKGFEVEISENGIDFNKIGFVDKNEKSGMGIYEFEIKNPNASYFRLKQMDVDDKFTYSNVVFVEAFQKELKIYPNPTSEYVILENILKNGASQAEINVFDSKGINTLTFTTKQNTLKIVLRNFQKGVYVIKVGNETKKIVVE